MIQIILDEQPAEIEAFLHGISHHGCVSGLVKPLNCTSYAQGFFDRHYVEIDKLRANYQDYVGEPVSVDGDIKTEFAWFGFEETVRLLSYDLGLDL